MTKHEQDAKQSLDYLVAALVFLLLVCLAFAYFSFNGDEARSSAEKSQSESQTEQTTSSILANNGVNNPNKKASHGDKKTAIQLSEKEFEQEAQSYHFSKAKIASLAARKEFDERAPIISPSQERELPSEQELADPELYLAFEAKHEQKFYQAYRHAAKSKLQDIDNFLQQNRAHLSAEQKRIISEKQQALKQVDAQFESLIIED